MPKLTTAVDPSSSAFQVLAAHNRGLRDELRDKVLAHGRKLTGTHHAHALHAPYWWLKCAVGTEKSDHPAVTAYHKLLVWDMMSRPWLTRTAESVLNPLIGKSVAMYFEKPVV